MNIGRGMQRSAMQAPTAASAGGKLAEDGASSELHKQVRYKVEDLARESENFLRRIEGCLEEAYEYGAARQDYEGILTRIAETKLLLDKRAISAIDGSQVAAKAPAVDRAAALLARAKKEQEDIDRQYERIAAAAAAAARTR